MTNAKFRVSTGILKALGEELNTSLGQSILELVKNAYDADALECHIELHGVDQAGGSIVITDNGVGMTPDDIVNGWLLLGKSRKNVRQRTTLNRIPAGNKGLGRLAALRMGEGVALSTVSERELTKEHNLYIDWSRFDQVQTVDEVDLEIETVQHSQTKSQGTEIVIEDLKKRIDRRAVKRLARALILLADPFDDNPEGFSPYLHAPQYEDLAALVQNRYFDQADFYLHAEVDNEGKSHAIVRDFKGDVLFEAGHDELTVRNEREKYDCPPATFDIWVFILSGTSFKTRKVTLGEVRDWLQTFGGVHLYENGLRVQPYGNPGNDWLDMNLARARNPEENPSTNTVIGRISVENLDQALIQKTDRAGFIEGDAFIELRSFAQDALHWLYRRRLAAAQKRREKQKAQTKKEKLDQEETLEQVINNAPESSRQTLQQSYRQYKSARDREVQQLRKEVQLYRTLSTAGITTATFAHESSGNPLKVISLAIGAVERRVQKYNIATDLNDPIEQIKKSADSLSVLSNSTLQLLDHEKRRIGRVDIHAVIQTVLHTFKPFLEIRDVQVETQFCNGEPFLNGSQAAIEAIITNLLNNSITSFERKTGKAFQATRVIRIVTEVVGETVILKVLDNGTGIIDIDVKDIWSPGETTQPNGTGLGLTIVRDSVIDLGGEVSARATSELGGAEIIVELPILGS